MTDPLAPLRAALAGHYEIEREIGQGAFGRRKYRLMLYTGILQCVYNDEGSNSARRLKVDYQDAPLDSSISR